MYGEVNAQLAQNYIGGKAASDARNKGMLGDAGDARQPEVSAELDRLAKAVEYVDHSLIELAKRMEGKVLRPVATQATGEGALASVGPSTGYGQELRQRSDRLNTVAEGLQDIIRRLEV